MEAEEVEMDEQMRERTPIKGFPELRWAEKRPYKLDQYYPAQLKETYGNSGGVEK